MNIDEVEIFEPLENSNLVSIIPKDDRILFSAIFEIFKKFNEEEIERSHVIFTDKRIAILTSALIPIPDINGAKSGGLYYFPWYMVHKSSNYSPRLMIGDDVLRFESEQNVEGIKTIEVIDKEIIERFEILMTRSKDFLYEKLAPILKTYPVDKKPMQNPSIFSISSKIYKEMRSRCIKDVRKGRLERGKKIKPLPKNTYYTRERIVEEVKNFNFEQGTYNEGMKFKEMAVVFANFFGKHTVEETIDLLLELFEINAYFTASWYNLALAKIALGFPKRVKERIELEKIISEKIIFKPLFKDDEYIIVDFYGQVTLPHAHLEYPGHIYLTNYQLLFPGVPKIKVGSRTFMHISNITLTGVNLISAGIKAGVKAHFEQTRKKFGLVLQQNPDMFYIKNPYNIDLSWEKKGATYEYNIKFTMIYDYKVEYSREKKKYKHLIAIKIFKLKALPSIEFKRKKKEVLTKFIEFFSQLPNTVCPKCSNIQDKQIKKCEKCGKKLKVKF